MVLSSNLRKEFEEKAEDFRQYFSKRENAAKEYRSAIKKLGAMSRSELIELLGETDEPGALPSTEFYEGGFTIPFSEKWYNHADARKWASEILSNRTTFAADGSQIYAEKSTSIPIAAVRIGWFENPHSPELEYVKDAALKILTPEDLFREQREPMNPDIRVEQQRYLGEIEKLIEFLRKKAGWKERGERMPLAFFDNPLLVPFSQGRLYKSQVAATVELIKVSQESKVPVVGFVSTGFSRDLLTMIETAYPNTMPNSDTFYDAAMLNIPDESGANFLDRWGDRTSFFYSKRKGLTDLVDPKTGVSMAGFIYIRTATATAPARADFPSWVYDSDMVDEVADIIRAECVVGLGYPYSLETADQTAVISGREKDAFFRMLQDLAASEGFDFIVSRKDVSKKRRR